MQWRKLIVAAGAPLLVCLALVPFREHLANTNVALALVLVIVAVAALGSRPAGALTAVSAAVWFDFFLTRPFERFTMLERQDVETTLLLLLVGVAVTEIAHWGRRQQARAGRQTGYLSGLQSAAQAVAGGRSSPTGLIEETCRQLTDVLTATGCRFDYTLRPGNPRLQPDGRITWDQQAWDADRLGLPAQTETEILATCNGRFVGRFLITATPGTLPPLPQRTLAVALADLAGVALGTHEDVRHG